jgi:maleate isomerase
VSALDAREVAHRALPALGLIVLRVDETIEQEFRHDLPPDRARLHVSRIDSGDDLTPESIAHMADRLTGSAALLPQAAGFDVVAYACTSGTALLGADAVAARIRAGVATRAVTDPLSAAVAQIGALGLRRVGLLSPYIDDVADGLTAAFAARGVDFAAQHSLHEREEARVARIGPARLAEAARALAAGGGLDGLFLSCTNLDTRALRAPLSRALGLPVLSSNAALLWHMQQLAGAAETPGSEAPRTAEST